MGNSTSSTSEQIANTNITQQYSGSCQISCNNKINQLDITAISSNLGDINVTQSCAVNGQCMMNSTANALADVVLKAQNAASSALPWIPTDVSNMSIQQINENIQQYVSQKCNISSSNSMSNVSIYAVNSNIANGINIEQNATAGGTCALSNLMSATAQATAMADNCAASGKSAKKKSCSGKGGGLGSLILYGIIGIVLFTGVMMVIKYMKGDLPDCTDDLISKKTPCKPVATPKPSPFKSSPPRSPYISSPIKYSPPPSPYTDVELAEPAPLANQNYEGEEMYVPPIEDSFVNTPEGSHE
jgi:hypothetical protein